eukprot:gene25560-34121_t
MILLPIIASFGDILTVIEQGSKHNKDNFPHKEVQRILKCYESFNRFIWGLLPSQEEVIIYRDLFLSLFVIEKGLKKNEAKSSFAAIVKAIQYFLDQIDKVLESKQACYTEKTKLEEEVKCLKSQLDSIVASKSQEETNEDLNYIVHDGLPLLYVHHHSRPAEDFQDWREFQEQKKKDDDPALLQFQKTGEEYTAEKLQNAARMNNVIGKHFERLFASHSNLVAIRPSDQLNDGAYFIEFVVLCKNFIPSIDKSPLLPRDLDGIPTRVSSGWIELCGRSEQLYHRPLRPGAGFAVAKLDLPASEEDYHPPVIGTIGGFYITKDGQTYGVTCGHCLRDDMANSNNLHPVGSPIFQPCTMGMIVNAASTDPGLLDAYDTRKESQGHLDAMKWMITQLRDNDNSFSTDLPLDAQCGCVLGGVLGSLDTVEGTHVVDVGLVALSIPTLQTCFSSRKFPELHSPELYFKEGEEEDPMQKVLQRENFPQASFYVYGRGARSIDTMRATVNPLQTDMYFRTLELPGDLVFRCIHAETNMNWQPGDSGTWCWTADKKLVGMGMGYAHTEGKHFCCMLPMADVLGSIQHLMMINRR